MTKPGHENTNGLRVTSVDIRSVGDDVTLHGIATIVLNECFVVEGVRIVRGKFGPFVSFPSGACDAKPLTRACDEFIAKHVLEKWTAEENKKRMDSP